MTRALSSYTASQRIAVINRRIKNNTGGLGYWAAKDALERMQERTEKATKKKTKQQPN